MGQYISHHFTVFSRLVQKFANSTSDPVKPTDEYLMLIRYALTRKSKDWMELS